MKSVNTRLETRALHAKSCSSAKKAKHLAAKAASRPARMAADRFTCSARTKELILPSSVPTPRPAEGENALQRLLWALPFGPAVLGGSVLLSEVASGVGQAMRGAGDFLGGMFGWAKAPEAAQQGARGGREVSGAAPSQAEGPAQGLAAAEGCAAIAAAPASAAPSSLAQRMARGMREVSQAVQFQVRAEQEVEMAARECLGRPPRPEEMPGLLDVYNQQGTYALYFNLGNSPEGRIARIFEEEVGRPIDDEGRANWLKEHEKGDSFERIRARLHEIMEIRAGRA